MNAVPRLLTEPRPLVFHCARILLLGLGEFGKPLVPPALQAVCHQPVFWPDEHELTLRQLRLLAGALDLGAVKAMELAPARSQLLEHFEGNLQWSRGESFQGNTADDFIQTTSGNDLAGRLSQLHAAALADVDRSRMSLANILAHR